MVRAHIRRPQLQALKRLRDGPTHRYDKEIEKEGRLRRGEGIRKMSDENASACLSNSKSCCAPQIKRPLAPHVTVHARVVSVSELKLLQ
jgi:hypothetical protein